MKKSAINNITELRKLLVLNRIRILELLYDEETCVCEMVDKLNIKHNLLSHHLKTLSDMEYINSKRNGQHILYSLNSTYRSKIYQILQLIT